MATHKAKILLATDLMGNAVVLATDSKIVLDDIKGIGTDAVDAGIIALRGDLEAGFHLWEGDVASESGEAGYATYDGSTRIVTAAEAERLYGMTPVFPDLRDQ